MSTELEKSGLFERKPHPTDGRRRNIALTAKGAAMRSQARDAGRTWLAQAIAKLNPAEPENLRVLTNLLKPIAKLRMQLEMRNGNQILDILWSR